MVNTNPKKTVTKKAYPKPTAMSNKQVVKKDGKTVVTYDSKKTGAFGMATYPAKVTKVYDNKGNLIRGNRRVQGSYGSSAMERIYDPKKKPTTKPTPKPVAKAPVKPTTKTVVSSKGKTVYDPKAGTKTVYDSKGKTVTNSKAGTKTVYDKKGKTETDSYGKGVSNKQGYTYVNKYGQKHEFNKQGRTTTLKDGSKIVYDKQGSTKIPAPGKSTVNKPGTGAKPVATPKPGAGKPTPKPTPKPGVNTPVAAAKTVSQLWSEKTGTSWSEAKKQGLSDGSAKSNMELMKKLQSGSVNKETIATMKDNSKVATLDAKDTKVTKSTPATTTTPEKPEAKPTAKQMAGSGMGAMERMEGMYKKGGSVKRKMKSKKK